MTRLPGTKGRRARGRVSGYDTGVETVWVTNGDAAGGVMRMAGFEGEVVPWRDVLHEGPVPDGLGLEALSRVRADFIAAKGWAGSDATRDDVRASFAARDAALVAAAADAGARVVLWFEHDLYDQLQLLQVLAWLADASPRAGLEILVSDNYLGALTPEAMAALRARVRGVTPDDLATARAGFAAFRSADARALPSFLAEVSRATAWPHLPAAITRLLEERPGRDGLARTRRQILAAIAPCAGRLPHMFVACAEAEPSKFVGDLVFLDYVRELATARVPALAWADGEPWNQGTTAPSSLWRRPVALTDFGRALLAGRADWVARNGIDRWIGGLHLSAGAAPA